MWDDARREAFGQNVIDTLEERFPNIRSLIVGHQFVTPKDIEDITGPHRRATSSQGELSLEQLFFNRPVPGWSRYRTPVEEPLDVRVRHASRRRHHGRPRADRGARVPEGEEARTEGGLMARGPTSSSSAAATTASSPRRTSRRPGGRSCVLERAERRSAGSCATRESAPGFRRRDSSTRSGRLRRIRGEGPEARAVRVRSRSRRTCACTRRMPDGSAASRSGATPRARPRSCGPGAPHDADAYLDFDKRRSAPSRASSRYINVVTPPDPEVPFARRRDHGAEAGQGVPDLGAKTGRETIRALPMAVADLVQETFEDEAIRGPLATRGVLYTAMGAWATGTAAVFMQRLGRQRRRRGRTAVFAKGGTGALADALDASAARASGVEIRVRASTSPTIRTHDGRVVGVRHADGTELDAPHRGLGRRPEADAAAAAIRWSWARTMVWRGGQHPPARRHREGQPRARPGLPAFAGRDPWSVCRAGSRSGSRSTHVEQAMDAAKYGHVSEDPLLEATIPSLADPSLAPEGKHVMCDRASRRPRGTCARATGRRSAIASARSP